MSKRTKLILVGAFFALLFVYAGANIYWLLAGLSVRSDPGWFPGKLNNRILIRQAANQGPASLLRFGDEVVAINGQPITDTYQVIEAFQNIEPEASYTIVIRRDGQLMQLLLSSYPKLLSGTLLSAASIIITAIFLITGLVVFLLKPFDKQAILLALMFGMFIAVAPASVASYVEVSALMVGAMVMAHVTSLFFWPVFFHFFLIFPEPSPLLRRFSRLEYYLYLPHLLTLFPYLAALNILVALSAQAAMEFRRQFSFLGYIGFILATAYIAGGLLSLIINYRQAGRPSRRKMRIVVAGSIAGFLPMFIVVGLAFLFNLPAVDPGLFRWLALTAFIAFPLFPLAFAYAIVRHKVIPVRLILRRSVRYLLVSRGFVIVQAVVVFAVLSFVLTGSRMSAIDRLGSRADIVVTMVVTTLAIALLTIVNQRVMPLIDRRFFREAYDAQQVLSDLGQSMRTVTTIRQLLELAAAKIQDALHTENVTIFLLDAATGDYLSAITSRQTTDGETASSDSGDLSLPGDAIVVERLAQSAAPLNVDLQSLRLLAQSSVSDEARSNELRERAILRRAQSALLLPVATKDEMLGIISLGPRLGDLPFSREDKQLLTSVAWQMAFAIKNAQLAQEIAEEERLRHELEIAKTVQRRLFPACPPQLARIELSGVCHPARGVGGDYYDFIPLDNGNIGIAVADVAGKGISAALLMSTVQASLRIQAPSVNGNLTELVSSMNRLLHVSTDASSYATFFYAQFDETTGLLTYVNAGHNPPILVREAAIAQARGAGQSVMTARDASLFAAQPGAENTKPHATVLSTGGLIIGAFHGSKYEQETIQLYSGDVIVAYTDGVTEALNSKDEEFGETRLRQIIIESSRLSAEKLSDAIVESVREWCLGAPQHDDLTLIVMKVR